MSNNIINLTGHGMTLVDDLDNRLTIPAAGPRLRVDSRRKQIGYIAKFPVQVPVIVFNREINKDDLPPKVPGTVYIVSIIAALSYPWRDDFVVPGRKVLDGRGRVVGCRSLRVIV
jgi:hypothetical protein